MRKHFFSFLVLFFSFSLFAHAAEPNIDSLITQGKASFSARDFTTAYDIFHEAFLLDPANLDINFHLGRAAFEIGDYESALMAFDRILIMDPQSLRVKLEIGRCHMKLGAFQVAKQYFHDVLDSKPPKPVVDNIALFLAAIKATEKKHFISGSLSLGLSTDSNVRSAPGDFLYTWNSIQFPLSSEPTSDRIFTATAALNHIYNFEDTPYAWQTTVTNFNSIHDRAKDLDAHYYGVSSGPAYQGNDFFAEIHASGHELLLDHNEYLQITGTGGSITFASGQHLLVNSTLGIEDKKYSKTIDLEKDATNYNISLSPSFIFGKNRITPTFMKEWENADTPYWSYDRIKFGASYNLTFYSMDMNLFTKATISKTNYDAINTAESVKRSDKVEEISLGAEKILWKSEDISKYLSMQIAWTYTNSESNISLYAYRKKVLASLLSFGF